MIRPVRDEAGGYTRGYRAWMLFILLLMNILNLADRQGLAAIAPALKRDLALSDTQLGVILGLGFAIFYTLFGLPIARLSESRNRVRIIAVSIAVFSSFGALASRAQSILVAARVPGRRRHRRCWVRPAGRVAPRRSLPGGEARLGDDDRLAGAPIGALAGAAIGGYVAQHSDWRLWFVGLSLPGFAVAALAFFTLREPRRGAADAAGPAAGAVPSTAAALKFLLSKKSMRHVLAGGSVAAIALNGMGQFWPRYLVAVFHIGPAQAGGLLGIMVVVAMASGLGLGGFGVDWAVQRDRRWYVWGPSIALALAMPLFLVGLSQTTLTRTMVALLPAHIALFVFFTPTLAIAQNIVDSSMRASSAFTVGIVFGLVGPGLGPTIVGVISDLAAHRSFTAGNFGALCPGGAAAPGAAPAIASACGAASAHGITVAMAAVTCLLLWGSVHYFLAARTLRADLDTPYRRRAR